MRTLSYVLGTGLLAVGLALLLGVGALYAYGAYERIRFERELALTPTVAVPPGVVQAEEVDTPTPTPTVATTPRTTVTPSPTATVTPRPTPTPTPVILPARRIIIPKINLDSPVVESPIKDGQWQVPKFVAGHLQGTANPGEKSNVVLAGHVESISSGNVFAEIDRLKPGDRITLVTQAAGFEYVVREKLVVKNDDLSVVAPTTEETLTLITCTGTFIPSIRDFDHRLVVVARPAPETRQVKPSARGGT